MTEASQEQQAASNPDEAEKARLAHVKRRLDDIATQLDQVERQLRDAKVGTSSEITELDKAAKVVLIWLVIMAVAAFVGGCYLLFVPDALGNAQLKCVSSVALIGVSGSAVAALISALERYANGYELNDGSHYPIDAKRDKGFFNARFAWSLRLRPILGFLVAPIFVWGLSHFTKVYFDLSDPKTLGFIAFIGGFLAKSILDLVKNLFKRIFAV
jgi:hypothetical protein